MAAGLSSQSENSQVLTPGSLRRRGSLKSGVLTPEPEENLPLAVLLPHGRRQVAGVAAAVSARQVAQGDAVGSIQQDQRGPQLRVAVPVGRAVQQIPVQQAAETRCPPLGHQHNRVRDPLSEGNLGFPYL